MILKRVPEFSILSSGWSEGWRRAIESIDRLEHIADSSGLWGAALWLDGSYGRQKLYIYGIRTIAGRKKPFVASVDPKIGINKVRDVSNWTFWNGKEWVTGLLNAASIVKASDTVSDEYSVKRFTVKGKTRYVMVSFDTADIYTNWKDIYLYSACNPQGPFNNKYLVYTTPESGAQRLPGMTASQSLDNKLVVYNPHLHPQFTEIGRLLISYNSNLPFGASRGDTIYADVYRPRFIEVRVPGLR